MLIKPTDKQEVIELLQQKTLKLLLAEDGMAKDFAELLNQHIISQQFL